MQLCDFRRGSVHVDGELDVLARCEAGEPKERIGEWVRACAKGLLYEAQEGQVAWLSQVPTFLADSRVPLG